MNPRTLWTSTVNQTGKIKLWKQYEYMMNVKRVTKRDVRRRDDPWPQFSSGYKICSWLQLKNNPQNKYPLNGIKIGMGCGIKRRDYDFRFCIYLVNIYNWFKYVWIAFTAKYRYSYGRQLWNVHWRFLPLNKASCCLCELCCVTLNVIPCVTPRSACLF